jgi:hypothetical protein
MLSKAEIILYTMAVSLAVFATIGQTLLGILGIVLWNSFRYKIADNNIDDCSPSVVNTLVFSCGLVLIVSSISYLSLSISNCLELVCYSKRKLVSGFCKCITTLSVVAATSLLLTVYLYLFTHEKICYNAYPLYYDEVRQYLYIVLSFEGTVICLTIILHFASLLIHCCGVDSNASKKEKNNIPCIIEMKNSYYMEKSCNSDISRDTFVALDYSNVPPAPPTPSAPPIPAQTAQATLVQAPQSISVQVPQTRPVPAPAPSRAISEIIVLEEPAIEASRV